MISLKSEIIDISQPPAKAYVLSASLLLGTEGLQKFN